jgi:hypothetical protein
MVVRSQSKTYSEATPTGIAVAIGAVAMIVAALVAAAIPASQPGWRFGVMAVAVGLFAAISLDQRALAVIALIAYGIANGFLEDRFGQLSWHGSADIWRALLLVMVGAWGLAVGEGYRFVRDQRERSPESMTVQVAPEEVPSWVPMQVDRLPAPIETFSPQTAANLWTKEKHGA